MKYLPEKFPIKFALVIESDDDLNKLNDKQSNILISELAENLKREPLIESSLNQSCAVIRYSQYNNLVAEFVKLNLNLKRIVELDFELRQFFSPLEGKHQCYKAYKLNPINYDSIANQPFILAVKKYFGQPARKNSGADCPSFINKNNFRDLQDLAKLYQSVIDGGISDADMWTERQKYKESLLLQCPWSEFWGKNTNEHVPVLICQDWQSLVFAEIDALYRSYNYCKQCGKALPVGYTGSYCDQKDSSNIECVRIRNKSRQASRRNI